MDSVDNLIKHVDNFDINNKCNSSGILNQTYIDKRNDYEVVNIEGNLNNLGILKNMPTSILSKLNISHSFLATNNDSEIEVSII